jgi:tartrate dehydratase beta subunit/fumarate hydratase class I family protein
MFKFMNATTSYLESVKKQFLYYKTLGEKAMEQLEPEQLFVAVNEDTNSIAVIVKHLSGNMLSRWTDFLTTDGEKETRNRDAEFENNLKTKEEVLAVWNKGWTCLFDALNKLQPEQLSQIIYIRNEGHTVIEAINRQLAHYPYHVGQIVFYAKMLKKSDWESLSIPRNKSNSYNAAKFAQEKSIKNFTDDELKKLK